MAAQAVRHRWFDRDARYTAALFAWIALAFSIAFYFSDWSPAQRSGGVRPVQIDPSQAAAFEAARLNAIYTGSIILVPWRGDECWQRQIDNRTGKMWDIGLINCNKAMMIRAEEPNDAAANTRRIRAIAKAFQQPTN